LDSLDRKRFGDDRIEFLIRETFAFYGRRRHGAVFVLYIVVSDIRNALYILSLKFCCNGKRNILVYFSFREIDLMLLQEFSSIQL
jgi:hypothetical protein